MGTSIGGVRNGTFGRDGCAGGQEANLVAATTQKIQTCIFVPKLTAKGKVTYKEDGGA